VLTIWTFIPFILCVTATEDVFGPCLLLWRLPKIPQKYTEALTGGLSGRRNSALDLEAERALGGWLLPHNALEKQKALNKDNRMDFSSCSYPRHAMSWSTGILLSMFGPH